MKMRRLLVLLCALTTGCYATVLRAGREAPEREESRVSVNVLWGIVTSHVDMPECRYGLARVEIYIPWWDYIVEPITAGIVRAHQTDYICQARPEVPAPPTASETHTDAPAR